MAAAKVFSIPELLEHILLDASNDLEPGKVGTLQRYCPSTWLFRIQRINTFFRDTIQGSRKLKREMFLEHVPATSAEGRYVLSEESDADSANLRPVWWLLEESSDAPWEIIAPRTSTMRFIELEQVRENEAMATRLPGKMAGSEASWRNMTMRRTPPDQKYSKIYQLVRMNDRVGRKFLLTVDLNEHETLGELWDCYEYLLTHSSAKYNGGWGSVHKDGCWACRGSADR